MKILDFAVFLLCVAGYLRCVRRAHNSGIATAAAFWFAAMGGFILFHF